MAVLFGACWGLPVVHRTELPRSDLHPHVDSGAQHQLVGLEPKFPSKPQSPISALALNPEP